MAAKIKNKSIPNYDFDYRKDMVFIQKLADAASAVIARNANFQQNKCAIKAVSSTIMQTFYTLASKEFVYLDKAKQEEYVDKMYTEIECKLKEYIPIDPNVDMIVGGGSTCFISACLNNQDIATVAIDMLSLVAEDLFDFDNTSAFDIRKSILSLSHCVIDSIIVHRHNYEIKYLKDILFNDIALKIKECIPKNFGDKFEKRIKRYISEVMLCNLDGTDTLNLYPIKDTISVAADISNLVPYKYYDKLKLKYELIYELCDNSLEYKVNRATCACTAFINYLNKNAFGEVMITRELLEKVIKMTVNIEYPYYETLAEQVIEDLKEKGLYKEEKEMNKKEEKPLQDPFIDDATMKEMKKFTDEFFGSIKDNSAKCDCPECNPNTNIGGSVNMNNMYNPLNMQQAPVFAVPPMQIPMQTQQVPTKTADGGSYIIQAAVAKFIEIEDVTNHYMVKNGKRENDGDCMDLFNKLVVINIDNLVNLVQRYASQPCTDNEIRKLINDFKDEHFKSYEYIYNNDGKIGKMDMVSMHKKLDEVRTQLLIYKLSGLVR